MRVQHKIRLRDLELPRLLKMLNLHVKRLRPRQPETNKIKYIKFQIRRKSKERPSKLVKRVT